MAIFFDGATDCLATFVLNSIEWRIKYNLLQGKCPDSPAFRQVIPGAVDSLGVWLESGCFQIESAPISGTQKTTISWHSDEGEIRFRIVSVTPALLLTSPKTNLTAKVGLIFSDILPISTFINIYNR